MFRDTNLGAVRYVSILFLLIWWGFHPSCVFLLFFCVRLPRRGKWVLSSLSVSWLYRFLVTLYRTLFSF